MGHFAVKEKALQSHIAEMQDIEKQLDRIRTGVASVRTSLGFQLAATDQLASRLRAQETQLGQRKQNTADLKKAVAEIRESCFRTEQRIDERIAGQKTGQRIAKVTVGEKGADRDDSQKGSLYHRGIKLKKGTRFVDAVFDLIGYERDDSQKVKWDWTKGEIGAEWKKKLKAYLAKGSVSSGIGLLSGELTGYLLKGEGSTALKAQLMKDGKFNPQFKAETKVEGSVVSGEAKTQFGSEQNNVHGKLTGEALGGEAKLGVGAGELDHGKYGMKGEAGVEVYMAKGDIKGGISILGVDVDVKATGKAGAAGAKASAEVSNQGFKANAGVSAILGLEGEISVDWSDFEWPEIDWSDFEWPEIDFGWW